MQRFTIALLSAARKFNIPAPDSLDDYLGGYFHFDILCDTMRSLYPRHRCTNENVFKFHSEAMKVALHVQNSIVYGQINP